MKKTILIVILSLIIQTEVSSQSCLPDGITFSTQADIDNFQNNYPNCTEIEGSVLITGNNIANLNGLNVLTCINKSLIVSENTTLTSLIGLDNLNLIGENIFILYNTSLSSLTGLTNLDSISGDLMIKNNVNLTSLSGLENVSYIEETVEIWNNNDLTNFSGLENVEIIGGNLSIMYNDILNSFVGLGTLSSLGGTLSVISNDLLYNFSGFEQLSFIGGSLWIIVNNSLESFSGLNSVYTIGGDYIRIYGNNEMISLTGLENVTTSGKYLWIQYNDKLVSLSGISNMDPNSIQYLKIANNISLAKCEVESICSYLISQNGIAEIYDNAIGCNSQEEVEMACQSIGIQDMIDRFNVLIYPNPAEKEILISSKNITNNYEVNIYNQLGQKILHKKGVIDKIDISILDVGIYVIEIISDNVRIREKLIIN